MGAEYLVFDNSCDRKVGEEISELLPDIRIAIFPHAFIIEAKDLSEVL